MNRTSDIHNESAPELSQVIKFHRCQLYIQVNLDLRNSIFPFLNRKLRKFYLLNLKTSQPFIHRWIYRLRSFLNCEFTVLCNKVNTVDSQNFLYIFNLYLPFGSKVELILVSFGQIQTLRFCKPSEVTPFESNQTIRFCNSTVLTLFFKQSFKNNFLTTIVCLIWVSAPWLSAYLLELSIRSLLTLLKVCVNFSSPNLYFYHFQENLERYTHILVDSAFTKHQDSIPIHVLFVATRTGIIKKLSYNPRSRVTCLVEILHPFAEGRPVLIHNMKLLGKPTFWL